MEELHIHIWDDHGDLSEGWYMHTLTWMLVSSKWAGIIGEKLRMKELLAFMNTGVLGQAVVP